jgi:hypothetical protein
MSKVILLVTKILLASWSIFLLAFQVRGFAYVTQRASNLLRLDLWANFSYGFGMLFSIFCILSCFNLFKGRGLLICGILVQLLALISIFSGDKQYDTRGIMLNLALLFVYSLLWWLHFGVQCSYRCNLNKLN